MVAPGARSLMRLAPLTALLLALPLAAALPSPAAVHGTGLVTVPGGCTALVEFHAEFEYGTGLTLIPANACFLWLFMIFDGNDCHEFCGGICEDLGGGDAWCHFGDDPPGEYGWESRLRPDGAFSLDLGGYRVSGHLTRTAV